MQLLDFRHHRGIDRQSSGGVDESVIMVVAAAEIQRGQRDVCVSG